MVKPVAIECRNCDTEFDGTMDGPRVTVLFCPVHRHAEEMRVVLQALLDSNVFRRLPLTECMVADILNKVSPSAPVGASPSGSPVAPGANLQEVGAKQI